MTMICCNKQDEQFIDKSRAVSLSLSEIVDETKSGGDMTESAVCVGSVDLTDDLSLSITVSENPVNIGGQTKGTNTTTSSFPELYGASGFKVYAEKLDDPSEVLFSNVTFKLENSLWSPETPAQWPDYGIRLYAWAPGDAATLSSSDKTFSYTVENINEEQTDLLIAQALSRQAVYGTLPITFRHALCEVKFTTNVKMPAGSLYSLKISGVKLCGTYDFESGLWTIPESSETGTITLDLSSSPLEVEEGVEEGTALTTSSQTFFIIPQTCTENTKLEISFKSSEDAEVQTHEINLPDGLAFRAGQAVNFAIGEDYSYVFRLMQSSQQNIVFNNTVTDEEITVPVDSRIVRHELSTDVDWKIKSVKVGSAAEESINSTSFVDKGGLSATISEGNLVLQASARTAVGQGSHAYWVNEDGISGDEDGSGWSPKSWGADGEDKGTIDLSKYDPYTDNPTAHAMTTANCYIIRHAGTYKLPLVYGNGIVGGEINSQSYYPDATGGESRLVRFKNHLDLDGDGGIISPFIEYNTTDGLPYSEGSNSYLAPAEGNKGAHVVWQDRADIITIDGISKENVSVGGRNYDVSYITFTISQDVICQNNAILAVEGEDGIMWSWHIWTTNDPALLSDAISVKNFMSYEYRFFPMYCIGWVDAVNYPGREAVKIVLEQDESGNKITINVGQNDILGKSLGCHYQWGRKDPMPTIQQPTGFNTVIGGVTTLSGSIRNPGTFYGGTNNDWLESGHYNNLWTGKFSDTGVVLQNENLIKTVYDPSPVGYKLPASSAFTGFTTNGQNASSSMYFNVEGEFDHGWHFYTSEEHTSTVYFPSAGYRDHVYGSLVNNTTYFGEYWSAVAGYQEGYCGYYLDFDDFLISPKVQGYRNFGRSVRPVLE